MDVTLHIPDDVAQRLSAAGGDISRRALEALALEGYRDQTLTLYQVSEIVSLSRVEAEDFLGNTMFPCPRSEKQIWTVKQQCTKRRRAVTRVSNFAA